MGFINILNVGYFVIRLYTTRVKCIVTLLSLHVSALLGYHQVTNVYNYNVNVNVIIVYISHLMMAQEGRNM
jgi:hypothetical protein